MENQFLFDFNFEDFGLPVPIETFVEPPTYCEEVIVNGKKHHACTFPNCGKLFRFKSEFNRHVVIHEVQRPFLCPYADCRKTFKRDDALKNHIRIHTGELPFKCEIDGCGLCFPTKAGLRYHHLKHKGDKPCTCSYPGCGKSFITTAQLKQHESAVNYHKKVVPQELEETTSVNPQATIDISTELPFRYDFEETYEKKVKKEGFDFDEFFAPDLASGGKIEWEIKDQNEDSTSSVNNDLQGNFEKMVKSILSENNALKDKLDMCNTLMSLMQENQNLKQKLKKATAHEEPKITSDFNEDKIFSFLNFDAQEKSYL